MPASTCLCVYACVHSWIRAFNTFCPEAAPRMPARPPAPGIILADLARRPAADRAATQVSVLRESEEICFRTPALKHSQWVGRLKADHHVIQH